MNRRFFLKILAGLGIASGGTFGLKRCNMNQKVSYLIIDHLPPAIKIDEIGWNAFLQKWNDDIMFLVKKQVLYYQTDFDWVKTFLKDNDVEFQEELLSERINFPPKTIEEHKKINQVLDYITKATIYRKIKFYKRRPFDDGNNFIDEILINGGLLFSESSQTMIDKTEQKLKQNLPDSYREFLQASNGMLSVYGRLLAVNEIDWLRIRDKDVMETWWVEGDKPDYFVSDKEYLDYDANGVYGAPEEACRIEYLENCLEIGDINQISDNSAYWLLNPVIQTAPNDWEAWVWIPGEPSLIRYRNFKEMMENRYRFDVAALRIDLLYLEEEFNQKT